jgi:hypothetical protein
MAALILEYRMSHGAPSVSFTPSGRQPSLNAALNAGGMGKPFLRQGAKTGPFWVWLSYWTLTSSYSNSLP